MTFGEMLRGLREKAGLTQAALAGKARVPLRTIQGWEQDYRCPVSPDFFKVVDALGVEPAAFAASVSGKPAPVKSAPKMPTRRSRKEK